MRGRCRHCGEPTVLGIHADVILPGIMAGLCVAVIAMLLAWGVHSEFPR